MPRSSKHKSSRHGSRDAREYSDSERDSGLKDRKGRDDSVAKASKDSSSSDKRKLLNLKDGKDAHGFGNGEYSDEYGSSKRRKDERGGDRWNGGEDERGEWSKKSKGTSDSKSRRKDESVGVYGGENEELKKNSARSDGKHKDSGRKESREGGAEKERKSKEVRSERSIDNEVQRMSKQVHENIDPRKVDELQSPELDNQHERRVRKKRDDSGDADKHQGDDGDGYFTRLSSKDEITKDGRQKDEKRKDEKYRDKYREDTDRENKHRHDKQQDERPAKDHTNIRSDDKHAREEKDSIDSRQKRTKLSKSEGVRDRHCDRNRDRDGEQDHDLESDRDRDRDRERRNEHDRAHDRDYELDRDHDNARDQDWDWDRERDHGLDWDRDRNHHRNRDGSHVDDRSARSKVSGTKKRTSDDRDDYSDTKSRTVKSHYPDCKKRSLSSSRADSDVDRGRSQPRYAYADSTGTSNKSRSPASNMHIGKAEHRNVNAGDPKYRELMVEQRTKSSREGYSGLSERGLKYESIDKPTEIDDGPAGDMSTERSSSAKSAPVGLVERSSSASIERRHMNKSGARWSLEIDENGRRNSIDSRDFATSDDKLGQELTLEKPLLDNPPLAEASIYCRNSQDSLSLIPPPPAFKAAPDRPFMGSLEDDVRDTSNSRYRRGGDPSFGRGHGNSWRSVPNWTSPVHNGFVSFQPGPAHGGFHAMMPQFTSQPLFGVRPSMEVNHAGIPYHIADADRFSGHLRPLGWQNMMDGTGPAHLHAWDGNNNVFRDDPHRYGGPDWDRNRHSANSRGWESGPETWKGQNGDPKKDLPSPALKDESVPTLLNDSLPDQSIQIAQDYEPSRVEFLEKPPETKSSRLSSPAEVPFNSLPPTVLEKVPDTLTTSDNNSHFGRFYLSKLDISAELVLPELYDQCMCVVNVDKNASIDADARMELFPKNGSRAQQKYPATLSRHSPFPAIDNSIFQKAIDLYKKHRVELPNGGKVEIISASNQVQGDNSVPNPSLENRQVSAPASDGKSDVLITTLEETKVEKLSPAKEHLEELDQTCCLKQLDRDCTHEIQEEAVAGSGERKDEITSDQVNSEGKIHPMELKNESVLQKDGDNMKSKAKTTGFSHFADQKVGFGDTMGNPLIFEDGSPRASDALLPGSNESESLIISRIHHSPESTH